MSAVHPHIDVDRLRAALELPADAPVAATDQRVEALAAELDVDLAGAFSDFFYEAVTSGLANVADLDLWRDKWRHRCREDPALAVLALAGIRRMEAP